MTPERRQKLERTAQCRQLDWTVVLENVHDPHNISAVLRTCESAGIPEIYVIYTHSHLNKERLSLGQRASSSARKWVDVHFYDDLNQAITDLKKRYSKILGAYMNPDARSVFDLNMTEPHALVFGNEKDGLTNEMVQRLDGQFYIPQYGLVQSLNISVACAVSIYEGVRQRTERGLYDRPLSDGQFQLFNEYVTRHENKHLGDEVIDHS